MTNKKRVNLNDLVNVLMRRVEKNFNNNSERRQAKRHLEVQNTSAHDIAGNFRVVRESKGSVSIYIKTFDSWQIAGVDPELAMDRYGDGKDYCLNSRRKKIDLDDLSYKLDEYHYAIQDAICQAINSVQTLPAFDSVDIDYDYDNPDDPAITLDNPFDRGDFCITLTYKI